MDEVARLAAGVPVPVSGVGRGFRAGRPSLITYLMAGYPDRAASLEALAAVEAGGADVIELGVPYGDPLADGPVIVEAAKSAMAVPGGFGLAEALMIASDHLAGDPAAHPPVVLMTYLNPLLRMGLSEAARRAAAAGVAGFIVPDLPPDGPMAAMWLREAEAHGLDTVFLIAPTSTRDRIDAVVRASRGFVYCVSSVGVTGERDRLPEGLEELVGRVREAAGDIAVAVGFGVGTPEQAAAVARIADGVVVGSAIVRRQTERAEIAPFVGSLRAAIDGPA